MLNKLIKYELKYIFKFLIIFYSLSIFFGILTRIFLNIENSAIFTFIGHFCNGVTISMIINILINNLMRLWVRFKNTFYGDESYLTHTLPVTKKTLYLSKILVSIISIFVSILVIILSLFIAYYSKDFIIEVKNLLLPLVTMYNSSIVKFLLIVFFVFFLEFANGLQAGFTGIILGHKMNNYKTGFSVLYGFITYGVIQVCGLITIFVVALFNKDIMNLFFTNEILNLDMLKLVMYLAIIFYSIMLVINYFVNVKLFNKGVNVD